MQKKPFLKIPGIGILKKIYLKFFGPKRYNQLFDIIKKEKPKRIMEIGVWDGEHALQMITLAKEFSNKVEYFGFDLFEDLDKETFSKEIAKQPPEMDVVKKKLEKTGCKIYLYKGNTKKTLPDAAKRLSPMDLIIIDGGHSIETIENDWRYSEKLMAGNTSVVFDDYWNRENEGCKKLIDGLDRKKYIVELLPVEDVFLKKTGLLKIKYALVKKK